MLLLQLGVLLLIYSSGTFIRLAPISNWGVYVTADDPVLHVRVTEYVLENGHLPRNDSLSWYPWGQNWETTLPNFRYYLTAGLYSLGKSMGFGISVYDFCVLFPAFFAPLAVFPMFLLVRLLGEWKSGLIAAGVLVLSSGYLTRTIAGFYRHEHVGLPLLILCVYFFIRAMRADTARKNAIYSVLSGLVLVLLTGTWSGFRFLLDGYAVVAFLALITRRMDDNFLRAFIITDSLAMASTFLWPNLASQSFYLKAEFTIPLIVIITAIVHHYVLKGRLSDDRLPLGTIGVAVILLLVTIGTYSSLPRGRLEIFLNPLRGTEPGDVSQTVAEHASMRLEISNGRISWPALKSYGIFLFLVPIGVVIPFLKNLGEESNRAYLSLMIFATFLLFMAMDPYPALVSYAILWLSLIGIWYLTPDEERPSNEIMLIIIFVLLAAYFFKNMIRLNILFSAFVAIQSGICFAFGLDLVSTVSSRSGVHQEVVSKSRRRRDKRRRKKPKPEPERAPEPRGLDTGQIALVAVLVIFLIWTTSTSYNSARAYPLGLRGDWFDALAWIEENSQEDDVIMSWWDYGYWIQTYAGRPTIADGATTNWTQIRKLARAFVTTEATGVEFCREYGVRYIMVDVSDDFIGGKWTAMAHIAKQNVNEYMGIQEGQTVIYEKGQKALLFKLASEVAMSEPFPLDEHFEFRETFSGERGGVVVVYEFIPDP